MDSCREIVTRSCIVIGLITSVVLILYLTPLPNQYPQSCSRKCHELDWPMICRVKFTLEKFQTLGSPCENCPRNKSDCLRSGCITVDGQNGGILTVNRQFPGPTLEVCQHDIILVDVVNRIAGQGFGVHWRGQPQADTPYMDGVPMITQCPIPSFTTFQYKFRATESGTHLWQVNTGDEFLETLFGPLIVKKPDSKEIHRKLYDTDRKENVVVIHNWNYRKLNSPFGEETSESKLLINGKTQENGMPPSVFNISAGKRHRFRVIYASGNANCQIRLTVDDHKFLAIALDGHPIKPKLMDSAKLFPGERLDFILRADQKIASYHMRAKPTECKNLKPTSALIQYEGVEKSKFPIFNRDFFFGTNKLKKTNKENCISEGEKFAETREIEAAEPIPKELSQDRPDLKFYFFYNSTWISGVGERLKISHANNLTMILPSSPLVSQEDQLNPEGFCNEFRVPEGCRNAAGNACECVHVVNVPIDAIVELVLVNQDRIDHVFHMHGYAFRVIGSSRLPTIEMTPDRVKLLDMDNKLLERNFNHPPLKDTVALVKKGVVALRFKADNPGYWMLDEERSSRWFGGMSLIFKVGAKSDLPPVPDNFPKCGDWIGPKYFLA